MALVGKHHLINDELAALGSRANVPMSVLLYLNLEIEI